MKVTNWLIIGVSGLIIAFMGIFLIVSYQDKRVIIGEFPYSSFDYHPYYKYGIVTLVIGLAIFITSIVMTFISTKLKPLSEKRKG